LTSTLTSTPKAQVKVHGGVQVQVDVQVNVKVNVKVNVNVDFYVYLVRFWRLTSHTTKPSMPAMITAARAICLHAYGSPCAGAFRGSCGTRLSPHFEGGALDSPARESSCAACAAVTGATTGTAQPSITAISSNRSALI
jgi:hypothetical protein